MLRLNFEVDDLDHAVACLHKNNIPVENIRTDGITGKQFVFFRDPDGLPLELYEK